MKTVIYNWKAVKTTPHVTGEDVRQQVLGKTIQCSKMLPETLIQASVSTLNTLGNSAPYLRKAKVSAQMTANCEAEFEA